MSTTMRAVIAVGQGGPEVLRIVERPRPEPGEGQLLVRVESAGINRPDVMQREGRYPPPPGASDVLGLELAGIVEALGSGAGRFRTGDRVMALVHSGAYAEWAVVDEGVALKVPDGLPAIEAGAIPETYLTVWSNVFERARLRAGESLLIHGGASGIGTTAILLAKAWGARVIVTAGSSEKCAACLRLGADAAIDYRREDFVAAARAATDGGGPDVILDMVGGPYIARNLDAVAVDGRIAQIAFQQGSRVTEIDLQPLLTKRVTLTGSTLRARPVALKARLAEALAEHVLPLLAAGRARPPIDSVFAFDRVAEAHARMDGGQQVGKIVLSISDAARGSR
ncbi:NADPH2:quinone reductase [Methylobacterium sp. PvP062]|uniref:PIG3 family NAD(P)H quinone oxidoreductase n=1 Tax=Methylobacterium radiotolerans TaxID=31998 RepID=A0ABV2NC59_9HYPH|nr:MULTISPECIES: NAD(P)H-quinone oxidoreductase [unclassified Methylobacterium]MBP2492688.1 putative PIG3 family NAD(P)H quinone oxidoreductase [Methylobacterium sp. PvP105]MBP2500940.1 putative PIG3 family NAD(P)H quinone oxidoreductase [Methylobacterium sp. PvP109]MCX7335626.1 NAD(P)H-quinone oxidoreductase [Hyphomicrobiales bacterium]